MTVSRQYRRHEFFLEVLLTKLEAQNDEYSAGRKIVQTVQGWQNTEQEKCVSNNSWRLLSFKKYKLIMM